MTYQPRPATYEEALARRALVAPTPQMVGSSGYFAQRSPGLDPALFERGDHLRPEVRRLLLSRLYDFWGRIYAYPQDWSTAWIAGSGITTAWNADREAGGAPGDLDILIGVDYSAFFQHNPRYRGNSEKALAQHFNKELHDGLWSTTASTSINGSVYEVTYYVNPGGADIRDINPYAAYDVTNDSWTVHPVDVPAGFGPDYFSNDDRALIGRDQDQASGIVARYNQALNRLSSLKHGAPEAVNVARDLHQIVREGSLLFDAIHQGRKAAFHPDGKGYFDIANYRWQAGKGSGTIPAMRVLKQLDKAAHQDITDVCDDPDHLLLVASLANGGG